jgi:hypothetical protein
MRISSPEGPAHRAGPFSGTPYFKSAIFFVWLNPSVASL